jgi:hypothetical protein
VAQRSAGIYWAAMRDAANVAASTLSNLDPGLSLWPANQDGQIVLASIFPVGTIVFAELVSCGCVTVPRYGMDFQTIDLVAKVHTSPLLLWRPHSRISKHSGNAHPPVTSNELTKD